MIVDRLLGFMGGGGEEEAKTGLAPTVYRLAERWGGCKTLLALVRQFA